jgi:hypothetical protein
VGHARSSMTTSTTFFIPDTSPLLSYSPCANCASGWIAAYYTRADGYDQTFHEASTISNGSTVAFNITGMSLLGFWLWLGSGWL